MDTVFGPWCLGQCVWATVLSPLCSATALAVVFGPLCPLLLWAHGIWRVCGGEFSRSNVVVTGATEAERARRKLAAMTEAAKHRKQ